MRVPIIAIGQEYSLNPDQLYAFARERGGYAVRGNSVDDATVPVVMKTALTHDFRRANRKGDWRFVSESLVEFLKSKL